MSAILTSIATAIPEHSIEQEDAACLAQQLGITERWHNALPGLYKKSGVQRRGSVLLTSGAAPNVQSRQSFYTAAITPGSGGPTTQQRMSVYATHAGPLLETACRNALLEANCPADDITHLVTISCTGFVSPGIDHWVIRQLELRSSVQRTHVGFMGCHGMLNGLRLGQHIAASDSQAKVLVGAVELCSLHQQYTNDAQQLVANSLFADGAAAALIQSSELPLTAPRDGSKWMVGPSFSWMLRDTQDLMAWKICDFGFEMVLSPEVPSIIESQLPAPVHQWLQENGLTIHDIDAWAIHPGGPRILDAVQSAFQLDSIAVEPSRKILATHGNMSSPTVLFIVKELMQSRPTIQRIAMIAFGPGLHAELLILSRS